jgi:two-component system sensor histidine kinase BaeS
MSLRLRLTAAFAIVALLTAGAVALATPAIVGRGFALVEGATATGSPLGGGRGPGPMAGAHAQQVQQDTVIALIGVALIAAAGASLLGFAVARGVARPLGTLEGAAAAIARGDLGRRSGLADRTDEVGSLGRSFDTLAASLEGADEARRRFLQDVVHELKTPLAVIDATTSAVLDGVYEHDDRHLETIRGQARQLSRIVDDLRTIGLAESGVLPLRLAPTPLAPLVADIASAFGAAAAAAGGSIEVRAPGGLVVRADADRLRQAIAALVDNAIRHAPGTPIAIEATPRAGAVRIEVRDGGPGIPEADLPHVFERFYQADESRDRTAGTSGLGLAIVKAIADAHGASVGAANVTTGGARFWIDLAGSAG